MFIIDDIVLRSIGISVPGLDMIWTLEQIQMYALKGYYNPERIRDQIKETRLLYEFGEIDRQEYEQMNSKLLHKLDVAQKVLEMDLGSRVDILG